MNYDNPVNRSPHKVGKSIERCASWMNIKDREWETFFSEIKEYQSYSSSLKARNSSPARNFPPVEGGAAGDGGGETPGDQHAQHEESGGQGEGKVGRGGGSHHHGQRDRSVGLSPLASYLLVI